MIELVGAALTALAVVFVAEIGDKTQLLALGFGARHGIRTVAFGLLAGYGVAGALAAAVGAVLGEAVPERPVAIGAGVLFLVVAVATLLQHDGESVRNVVVRSAVLSIAATIAIAELGDKTQLATAALAAREHPVGTWVGATVGATAAGMIGAVAGRSIGLRVAARTLRWWSAALLAAFGCVLLIGAL